MATTTYVLVTYKDSAGDITQEKLDLAQDIQAIVSMQEFSEVTA